MSAEPSDDQVLSSDLAGRPPVFPAVGIRVSIEIAGIGCLINPEDAV